MGREQLDQEREKRARAAEECREKALRAVAKARGGQAHGAAEEARGAQAQGAAAEACGGQAKGAADKVREQREKRDEAAEAPRRQALAPSSPACDVIIDLTTD